MRVNLSAIPTSQILCSSEDAGYRDPAAVIHDGRMYCYYSYVERSGDGFTDFRLGLSVSEDLVHWEGPILLTERDRSKNWSSPGCVLRIGDAWAMCLQTYPTLGNTPRHIFGNRDSRIYLSRSRDLLHWSEPELLRVHGDDVPPEDMGRMITRTSSGNRGIRAAIWSSTSSIRRACPIASPTPATRWNTYPSPPHTICGISY